MFALLACSKDNAEKDSELPVVNLISPNNNQVFNARATVVISGSVTDNQKVAGLHIHISTNASGELLIDIHRYPETSSYS